MEKSIKIIFVIVVLGTVASILTQSSEAGIIVGMLSGVIVSKGLRI